MKKMIGTLCII